MDDKMQEAKIAMLSELMDRMTGHQLGGLKKKGAPAMMALEVKADKPGDGDSPNPLDALKGDEQKPGDDEDPEMLKKLMEMYGKGDDDKDENC